MPKLQRFFTEKKGKWRVGDIILHKKNGTRYQIVEIEKQSDGTHQVFSENIEGPTDRVVDALMFMDVYWINLGNSKYWKVLYGTKSKNSTDKLPSKG